MKVYWDINDVDKNVKAVLTIGIFDGVHLAHRQLLNYVCEVAQSKGICSFVITFHPHPQEVLRSREHQIELLTTTDEKLKLFQELGIQCVLVVKFTKEFSKTFPEEFYEKYVYSKIGIRHLIVGYDHTFGNDRKGNVTVLLRLGEKFNFEVTHIDMIKINNERVSSSRIRNYIRKGEIEEANSLLGREYEFEAIVVEGDKLGKELGYPTANLQPLSPNKVIPGNGVYCVSVDYKGKTYIGMMNIGFKPTLTHGSRIIMEVNMFDFNKRIYGDKLTVRLLRKLRDEMKFSSKEELIKQIHRDKESSLYYFNNVLYKTHT